MKSYGWLILVVGGGLAILLAVGGVATWLVIRAQSRPDFDRDGGTVLVYEVEDVEPALHCTAEDMVAAIERRLEGVSPGLVSVHPQDHRRYEVRITRVPGDQLEKDVQEVKELLSMKGLLEFRILANDRDDVDAIVAARQFFERANKDKELRNNLKMLAQEGKPPPPPLNAQGENTFPAMETHHSYQWVEIGPEERFSLGLYKGVENDPDPGRKAMWKRAADARDRNEPIIALGDCLLYSRPFDKVQPLPADKDKRVEYFLLTREAEKGMAITSEYLEDVRAAVDERLQPTVQFRLSQEGGELFFDLTSRNRPSPAVIGPGFRRHLAIILDDQVLTAPTLQEPIRADGVITGIGSQREVDRLVAVLRTGTLPVPLKPLPVSEITVGPGAKR